MHYIELPKYPNNKDYRPRTRFEKWLHLLKFGDFYLAENQPLPDDLLKEEGIAMAQEELRRVNADRELRQLMEVREREAHMHATILEQGRELRDIELIQKMLEKGKTPKEISELTDIPLSEVLRLAKANVQKPSPKKVSEAPKAFSKAKPRQSRKK